MVTTTRSSSNRILRPRTPRTYAILGGGTFSLADDSPLEIPEGEETRQGRSAGTSVTLVFCKLLGDVNIQSLLVVTSECAQSSRRGNVMAKVYRMGFKAQKIFKTCF